MTGVLTLLVHAALMVAAGMLLAGLLPWARAKLEHRAGPPMLQPWHEWRRLLRKQALRPEGTSPVFAVAPLVCVATTGLAALLVPSFCLGMATAPASDLVVVAGLLALSRVVLCLAALDAGTAPSALVARSRLRAGLLADPALLAVAFTVALWAGSTNLNAALLALRESSTWNGPLLLVLAGLAALALAAETEESVLAGFSSWQLAAVEAAQALRRVVVLSLLATLLVPSNLALPGLDPLGWLVAILGWVAELAVLGGACALAGPALRRLVGEPAQHLLATALLLVLLGLLFVLTGGDLA